MEHQEFWNSGLLRKMANRTSEARDVPIPFPSHSIPFRPADLNRHIPYEISNIQHWVVVGILMPIVIGLYLLLILVCYYLFCKKDQTWDQELQNQLNNGQQVAQSSDGSFTPPPSYAIFIGSGESDLIPPSYKMLFPPSYSNSFESAGSSGADIHSTLLTMPSSQTSNDLMDLNTPTHSETPSVSSTSSVGFPSSVTSTSSAFKLFPTSQIAIVCEAAHFPPTLGLHLQQQQHQPMQQQQQQQGHLSIANIGPISTVSTNSNASHYTNSSSTYEEGATAHAHAQGPLPLAAINPRFGSHGGILRGTGSQYLYFPFVHARHPSPRTTMVPRSGSEDVIPMASMPEEQNEADMFGESSPVFTSERARMRRGSSF